MKPIILKEHYANKDTIIYKDHVQNGLNFWNMKDKQLTEQILAENHVSEEQWQKALDAVEAGEGDTDTSNRLASFALTYCRNVENDPVMRQIVIEGNDPNLALYWCKYMNNDDDMRQVVVNAGDARLAFQYCAFISNDNDMRQVIINSKDPKQALRYCQRVSNDADMRQVIIDSGNSHWAYEYCDTVSNDEDMLKVAKATA